MPITILIATTNAGKVREIHHELAAAGGSFQIVSLKDFAGSITECIEDQPTFIGNAAKKARHFAGITGLLTLADDSGLCVDALSGAPGVYSARYAGVNGTGADAANNAKLLQALRDVPDDRRQGRFVCAMALALPDKDLRVIEDEVRGLILREPRGANGFGYDPFFFLPEFNQTTAELDMTTKNRISHRGKALRAMIAWMREHAAQLGMALTRQEPT